MHPWRKLHVQWITSERLRDISDEAFRLWVILVTVQDDAGEVPWDRGKVLSYVAATTEWNFAKCDELADELSEANLLTREERYITLYRGEEFNGRLRGDRLTGGFFHRSAEQRQVIETPLTVSDRQVTTSDGLEERKKRGELDENKNEIRGEEIPSSFDENTSNSNTLFEHLKNACERDIGRVEPSLSKMLNDFSNQHPDLPMKWVDLAFEEAVSYQKVSWAYIAAVLEAWWVQGYSGKERKENTNGKSRKDSSNDAKRNRPGAGFGPLSGQRARVS